MILAAKRQNYSAAPAAAAPLRLSVPANCAGLRLDQAIANLLPEYSRNRISRWIRDGRVYRPHQLSEELEHILHDKSVTGRGAWNRLFDETLARLHSFDPGKIGLSDFGRGENYVARQADRWSKQYRSSETQQIDEMERLIDSLPHSLSGSERARCQHLVFGVVRHFGRLETALSRLVSHPPRFTTRAVLLMAGFELIEAQAAADSAGLVAKIVHHAVEQTKAVASKPEAGLVNAVVRKLATVLAAPPPPKLATAETLAEYFSHPDWLVKRWLVDFDGPRQKFTVIVENDGNSRVTTWNK